jgi:ribosomal protein S18 acetylase RimI-like enzyme
VTAAERPGTLGRMTATGAVRRANAEDAATVGRLLDAFNREYDWPTPGPEWLAQRFARLRGDDLVVLLAGEPACGLAVLRFRPALWSEGLECYLAELYVAPERRGEGLGRALLTAALDTARAAGSDTIDLGTSEDDVAARALYERMGFTNREGPDGPVMYVYERDLDG